MSALIYVPGPTQVIVNGTTLGFSDNDNLPAIQFTDYQHEVKTVMSGAAPEEIVLQGTVARISVALVKWNASIYQAMLADQRGAYNASPVGRRIISDGAYFPLQIDSVSGTQNYTFNYAFLQPEGTGDSQWGNRERVLTLNFMAIPGADGFYTYTP
jgi:hypothetical protein